MKMERDYSDADLLHFTQKLIAKTNSIQFQITQKKNNSIVFIYKKQLSKYNKNSDGMAADKSIDGFDIDMK
jgi:capsule polysaccharide export protein KpsC/LpsZ